MNFIDIFLGFPKFYFISGSGNKKTFTKNNLLKISKSLKHEQKKYKILLCGGGRKNKILLKKIEEYLPSHIKLELIDDYKINGDFIESQAFAFLAIRSLLNLPISFPNTTGCIKPSYGGKLIKN